MVVNVIYCELPFVDAIVEEATDSDTHNIYVNKHLSQDKLREQIKHELSHIINDDFHITHHVNLVEEMVRRSTLNESELEFIEFYHHFIDN